MSRIVVLGSGAWGTAIALSLHRRGGHQVTLWSHSQEEARQIAEAARTSSFCPGFPCPPEIAVTGDEAAVADAEIVVSVVPSEFLRPTVARLTPHLHDGQIIVSATKGVEDRTFPAHDRGDLASAGAGGAASFRLAHSPGPALRWKWRRGSRPR